MNTNNIQEAKGVKSIPSLKRLNELIEYDAENGVLTWKVDRSHNTKAGDTCGYSNNKDRQVVEIDGTGYFSHRVIWKMMHGEISKSMTIDHINGNPSDNRLINLRCVSFQENSKNKRMPKNNTSGVIGVSWQKASQVWRAVIGLNGGKIFLGEFKIKQDAIKARKQGEKEYGYHENHGSKLETL